MFPLRGAGAYAKSSSPNSVGGCRATREDFVKPVLRSLRLPSPIGRQSLPIGIFDSNSPATLARDRVVELPNSPHRGGSQTYGLELEVRAEGFVFQLRYGLTVKSQAS